MANADATASNIIEVRQRLNQLTLDLIALHEVSNDAYEGNDKKHHLHTVLYRMTESCAKELEHCAALLGGSDGFATAHFNRYEVQA